MAETTRKTAARKTEEPKEEPTVYKVGSSGTEVLRLQQMLRQWGFDIPASGIFDHNTSWAVTRFQQERGLEVTGEITSLDDLDPKKYLG